MAPCIRKVAWNGLLTLLKKRNNQIKFNVGSKAWTFLEIFQWIIKASYMAFVFIYFYALIFSLFFFLLCAYLIGHLLPLILKISVT